MKIIADTHTHTIISGDAFSTLQENIRAAKGRGLRYLCLTEHVCSALPGAPEPTYFRSMHALPSEYEGIRLVRGVEVNILDYQGSLDVPGDILDWLDWVVASMHVSAVKPQDKEAHTRGWLAVARNPLVDVIGHCDDSRYMFDVERVIRAFADYGKIVELNEQFGVARPGTVETVREILNCCKKYAVPIVVSSDGHFVDKIGVFTRSEALLADVGYPEELVLNANEKRFAEVLERKRKKG